MQFRGCLHDTGHTGATFAPARVHSQPRPQGFSLKKWVGRERPWGRGWVHSGSLSTKCHTGVSSPRLLDRGENFTPVRNFAMVSCKRETTFRCEIGLPGLLPGWLERSWDEEKTCKHVNDAIRNQESSRRGTQRLFSVKNLFGEANIA